MTLGFRLNHLMAFILSILLTVVPVWSQDRSAFTIQQGGFIDLPDKAHVQGSASFGGIQPDYLIDLSDPDLAAFLESIKSTVNRSFVVRLNEMLGLENQVRNKKIEIVTALIQKAMPETSYTAPAYLKILEEHRLQNIEISLGSYLRCGAGVCRENALLTHFALKAVGVENQFVYVFVSQQGHAEDHAIVTVQDKEGRWIVDPYNSNFHGKSFDDIDVTQPRSAICKVPRRAKFAPNDKDGVEVKILRVNSYPTSWLPKPGIQCLDLFAS